MSEPISRVHVPSFTGSGHYLVEREGERLTCSCPAYGYNAEHPKRCKHTDLVVAADRLLVRCAEMHGTRGALCRTCLVAVYAVLAARKQRAKKSTSVRRRASSR